VGNLTQTKRADGSTEIRNYDSRNRLTQITTKNSIGYTFNSFDYIYGIDLIRTRTEDKEGFYHTDGLVSTRVITDNVGLVLDRYNYDVFGVTLNQTNTFGNSFQYAGEQRDSTELDYPRARYYNSETGRFISKDPFGGTLTDSYSQHDYQYAHANPVNNTDPTGYFTLSEAMATVQTMATLTALGSTSFGLGYIAGAGVSGEDFLPLFGEWGTGFASGVSGGALTDVYKFTTGEKIEPKQTLLYRSGNIAGISVCFLIGMRAPTWASTSTGPLKWVASIETGLNLYGAGKASYRTHLTSQEVAASLFSMSLTKQRSILTLA
jgi:RHS repeat-associated protein